MSHFPILELLQDSYDPPLSPAHVEELEIELGFRFPPDYTDFLLRHNGGRFTRSVLFFLPKPVPWCDKVGVTCFYGDSGDRGNDPGLVWYAQLLADRLPKGCLPIADGEGQGYVVLKYVGRESEFAGVWFWDSDGYWMGAKGDQTHRLADSFNQFLSMLQYDTYYNDESQECVPIFQAVERGNLRAVEQFLAEDGRVETRNAQGQTLLAAAVIYCWPKIVRRLLEQSADVNARDEQGRTPLHHAATRSVNCVKLLLQSGADIKARDHEGKGVISDCYYRADQILRAHGAEE